MRMRQVGWLVVLLAVGSTASAAGAAHATAALATDYSKPANWLCWPGRADDACAGDLRTTVVEADGSARVEEFHADPHPAIDCFYVYPTVSRAPSLNAPLLVGAEQRLVAGHQAARFTSRCRVFSPVYRQRTLVALRSALAGDSLYGDEVPVLEDVGYRDLRDAWHYYLAHENRGRGVVLIGHSQGAFLLKHLLADEVDGKPVQARLVSAILAGENFVVPAGARVGGDLRSIPLCTREAALGCVIAYASYRASPPPPASAIFGRLRPPQPGRVVACVNPAEVAGQGEGLKPYFGARPAPGDEHGGAGRWAADLDIATPFIAVPGLVSARCVVEGDVSYLAVTVHAAPGDRRAPDIPGDLVRAGTVRPEWGLHVVELDLLLGNLLDLVGLQAEAWRAAHR